jgi:hypothetical protein
VLPSAPSKQQSRSDWQGPELCEQLCTYPHGLTEQPPEADDQHTAQPFGPAGPQLVL